ncbi:MAG: serine/threonine-protein kinase, partial [Myxococcota bacterium]|nr:serine/threonine-protein kinase [Myxococcota bacterium]
MSDSTEKRDSLLDSTLSAGAEADDLSSEELDGLPDEREALLESTVSAGARLDPPLEEEPRGVDPDSGPVKLSRVAPARTLLVRLPMDDGDGVAAPLAEDEVRERLGRTAVQVALLFLIVFGVYVITYTPEYLAEVRRDVDVVRLAPVPVEQAAAVFTIVLSLSVFLLVRSRRLPSRVAVDVGLVYYVLVAAGISLFEHWEPWPTEYVPIHISWVCLWIALYPMMVPTGRGKLALAALTAAAAGPMALLASVAIRGTPLPEVESLTWVIVPPFLAVALAVYPGTTLHRQARSTGKIRELGAYQLRDLLSKGGMGEVWRGEHRLLARPAAIKLIRPRKFANATPLKRRHTVQRFEREARITASLRSPHTVELYDFGVTDDGSFYNVMELLDGLDLKTLVRKHGPLPPERAMHFLAQACDSLAEAHARSLVHRDIKPANLFACRYGLEVDFLKVLDFGLARTAQPFDDREDRITAEGMTAGTPAYIAPELASGAPDYDHRVDLYGLGCVGYWL